MKKLAKKVWESIRTFVNKRNDYFFLALGIFIGKTVEGLPWEGVLFGAIGALVLLIIRQMIKKPVN